MSNWNRIRSQTIHFSLALLCLKTGNRKNETGTDTIFLKMPHFAWKSALFLEKWWNRTKVLFNDKYVKWFITQQWRCNWNMKLQIGSHLQHICSHCIVIIALIWWVMMKIRNEFQEIPVNVPSLSFPFRIFQQNPKMITERTTITIAEVIVKINKAAKWSGFLERGRSPMSDRFGLTAMAKMKTKIK